MTIHAKIIGKNRGSYPYRVGLNTLAHNKERFDPRARRGPGGLYFCELKNIVEWLEHGDQLCIVVPVGQVVAVGQKFKTDRLEIVSMMSLREVATWEFLTGIVTGEHGRILQWAAKNGCLEVVEFFWKKDGINSWDYQLAMHYATNNGHLEVVKLFVEGGLLDVRVAPVYIHSANTGGHKEVVKYLREFRRAVAMEEFLESVSRFVDLSTGFCSTLNL